MVHWPLMGGLYFFVFYCSTCIITVSWATSLLLNWMNEWNVTFGTARRGLGRPRPRLVPSSLYQIKQPTDKCTNFILFDVVACAHWRVNWAYVLNQPNVNISDVTNQGEVVEAQHSTGRARQCGNYAVVRTNKSHLVATCLPVVVGRRLLIPAALLSLTDTIR